MSGLVHTTTMIDKAFDARVREMLLTELERPPKQMFKDFCGEMPSDRLYEHAGGLTSLGPATSYGRGQPVALGSIQQTAVVVFTHVTYGMRIEVDEYTKDRIQKKDANKLHLLEELAQGVVQSNYDCQDDLTADLINNGFSTVLGFDSKVLFATDHPNESNDGGTYSNRLTTDSDLTYTTLSNAVTQMMQMTNSASQPARLKPINVGVHSTEWLNINAILKNVNQEGTSERNMNVIRNLYNLQPFYNDYFTDTDAWGLVAEGYQKKGLRFYTAIPVGMDSKSPQYDIINQVNVWVAKCAFSKGCPPGAARYYLWTPGA